LFQQRRKIIFCSSGHESVDGKQMFRRLTGRDEDWAPVIAVAVTAGGHLLISDRIEDDLPQPKFPWRATQLIKLNRDGVDVAAWNASPWWACHLPAPV
jgi:hypothetical protein